MTEKKFKGSMRRTPLRKRAEEALGEIADGGDNPSSDNIVNIVHDLRVHQIELQMQNEELRHSEADLTEARDRLRELYDCAPVGYLTLDGDIRIQEANLAAAKLFGVDRPTLIGKKFTACIAPESQDDFYLLQRKLQDAEASGSCELMLRRGDGSTFPAHMEAALHKSSGLYRCVLSDITERRRAEKALRDSEQDLNRAQAVAHVGSWRLDARQELEWSDEIHRIFGIPKGTPLSYDVFLRAVHPEDRLAVDGAWRAALRGVPYDIEHRIVAGDTVKWVRERAELEFDSRGALVGAFGTTEDITERKAAEERLLQLNAELERRVRARTSELSESEEKFRTLAEESPNMIFIGQGGRLVYANPMCHRITRHDSELLESGQFEVLRLFSADSVDRVRDLFERSPLGGEAGICEASLLTRDRKSKAVLVSARRITYGKGEAIFGIVTDLTERKKMERVLERQRRSLGHLASRVASAQDEEQGRIAEGLHDGVAQLLVASSFKLAALRDSPQGRKCEPVLAEVEGLLSDSLNQIRSLAFELSGATLSRLGLGKALEELTDSVRSRHGVKFNLKVAGKERHLAGRAATILFKATRELMFNVIKHAGVKEASITMSWMPNGVRITVRDRGRGFRVDSTRGRGGPRSLGLLSVQERMRSIGGRSKIRSMPGSGTEVSLFLGTPKRTTAGARTK